MGAMQRITTSNGINSEIIMRPMNELQISLDLVSHQL